MPANLERFPEYKVELGVLSGAVTDADMLELFSAHDKDRDWIGVFARSADLSGVDIACFPALKRALAGNGSDPPGAEPKASALVNLSEHNEPFVRFWVRYASDGVSRKRRMFPTIEAACQWLKLPTAAAGTLAAVAATAEAGTELDAGEAQARRRLLKAASRIFRERGYAAMSVAEIVEAARVPRAALDGLAESKNSLIVHALLDAMGDLAPIEGDLAHFAAGYLSPAHKADVADGCAMAALAAETVRESPATRAAMTAGLTWQIDRLSEVAPGDDAAARHRAAIRAWAAMVGAVILARVSNDEALSQELLDEIQTWIADPAVAATAAGSDSTGRRPPA